MRPVRVQRFLVETMQIQAAPSLFSSGCPNDCDECACSGFWRPQRIQSPEQFRVQASLTEVALSDTADQGMAGSSCRTAWLRLVTDESRPSLTRLRLQIVDPSG